MKTQSMKIRETKPDARLKTTPQERAFGTDANLERPKVDILHAPNYGAIITDPKTGVKFRVIS